jgi:hypothetical protein
MLYPQSLTVPMLDVYMPMMHSAAIITAVKLGLFEYLAKGESDIDTLAVGLHVHPNGVSKLLRYLETVGYVEKTDRGYINSLHTQSWFTHDGLVDYSSGAIWTSHAWDMMSTLEKAVKSGEPSELLWSMMERKPELGPLFSNYMHSFAKHLKDDMLRVLPIQQTYTSILDIGGSHGLHSIALCKKYPHLSGTILDYPSALKNTLSFAEQEGCGDRIHVQHGSALDIKQVACFDVALMFGVAHNQTAEDNSYIFKQVYGSLKKNGLFMLHEYIHDDNAPSYYAAFDLTLLYETGTSTHSWNFYLNALAGAGFKNIRRIDLSPIEKGSFILAEKTT